MTDTTQHFRIERHKGRPVVAGDGEVISQGVYCDYILDEGWEERIAEFIHSGVTTFHLRVPSGSRIGAEDFYDSAFWTDDDTFPESDTEHRWALDRQADFILERCPDARFFIKFMTAPPASFAAKHPDQMQTDEDGRTYRQPSFCSEPYLRQLQRYLGVMIEFCEERHWAGHLIGYLGMPIGEGIMPLNIAGKMFDRSETNTRAFRRWLRNKYETSGALREAWDDPDVSFESAQVPRDADWIEKRDNARPTIQGAPLDEEAMPTNCGEPHLGLFHWTEECNAAPERDYCRFMRAGYTHWLRTIYRTADAKFAEIGVRRVFGIDALKQPQIGWQIQSSFDGIGDGQSFPHMFLLTGSWDMGEVLDDEAVRAVWNPADYYARSPGFAYESEGVTDSMALRGKIAFVENDARTYVGAGIRDQGAFRTPREVRAGLRRNAAMTLSRGLSAYWCNVGSAYFHDPEIQDEIHRLTAVLDRLQRRPHRETRNAIAFVVDDTGPLYEDFTSGYQTLALIIQRIRGLAHCGVPYRIYLLSDLAREEMPRYHTWLFPNLFRVTARTRALLEKKVLRDGNLAIFGPATGITDGRHLSPAGATDLLGVEMELLPRTVVRHVIVQDPGHPISAELSANLIYGDSMAYGPLLLPRPGAVEDAGGRPLGHANACWFTNHTGLFVREVGRGAAGNGRTGRRTEDDYALVWSMALPLPASLLRACARFAGSHVWCEEDDVIYAGSNMAAIHTTKTGPRTLALPRPHNVRDAITTETIGKGKTSEINLTLNTPETRIFTLD